MDLYNLTTENVAEFDKTGSQIWHFGGPFADAMGLAVDGANGKVYVARSGSETVDIYGPDATVPFRVSSGNASDFNAPASPSTARSIRTGSRPPNRVRRDTDTSFGNSYPLHRGPGAQRIVAAAGERDDRGPGRGTDLRHYRIAATNGSGTVSRAGQIVCRIRRNRRRRRVGHRYSLRWRPSQFQGGGRRRPNPVLLRIRSRGLLRRLLRTGTRAEEIGSALTTSSIDEVVTGLTPETTYHYRVVATNQSGTLFGPDHTFTTFPFTEILKDPCPNAHVRQQVGAALLPDCRAYELVSAPDTAVRRRVALVPDREPFGGYPDAQGRALYGIHSGAIPGPWNPTNRGVDPYLATRGQDGWTHRNTSGSPLITHTPPPRSRRRSTKRTPRLTRSRSPATEICVSCFEDGSTDSLSVRSTGRSSRGCREALPRRRASAPMGSFANASPPTGPRHLRIDLEVRGRRVR